MARYYENRSIEELCDMLDWEMSWSSRDYRLIDEINEELMFRRNNNSEETN